MKLMDYMLDEEYLGMEKRNGAARQATACSRFGLHSNTMLCRPLSKNLYCLLSRVKLKNHAVEETLMKI